MSHASMEPNPHLAVPIEIIKVKERITVSVVALHCFNQTTSLTREPVGQASPNRQQTQR